MSYLKEILRVKKEEIAELRAKGEWRDRRSACADMPPPRGFRASLDRPGGPHLIAELKKASPSKGLIRPDYDPVWFAQRYETCGASAISCLTDARFFQGSIEDLRQVRGRVSIPILRKDFLLDEAQIYEARAAGADAILLIVAGLASTQFEDLSMLAIELGMDILVEIHNEDDLERAILSAAPPRLFGINNRDLSTFTVDLNTTSRLAPLLPPGATLVSESGIEKRVDIERLATCGIHAVLVGETLMRRPDPGQAVRELLGQGE